MAVDDLFDVYSDAFTITVTPWGANITFSLHQPHPSGPSSQPPQELGTIRMSNEHLKAMVFMLRRQVMQHEEASGVRCEVPIRVLAQLGIAPEDWQVFWTRRG